MMNLGLKLQDKFDGSNKFNELKSVEGKEFHYMSDKYLLVKVNDKNSRVKELKSGNFYKLSSQMLWNKFFF
jgi:hypothetical protein